MAESYSVTAVLSAQDKNFSSVFGSAQSAADSLAGKLKSGLGFGVLVGIGQKAFSSITSAASGFTSELENTSAAWQTFEKNASMNGHLAEDIAKTKSELQSFAQQTIYSASDMATTYAQLDAVGIKSAESLVKGFGGIASAAENPAQAMKTLSQQGVQMAAKPNVAWQDFKLMLEQTPAGIAAVAKEMGMSTSEMVQAVQAGEIATEDFFAAVEKVGTSDAFTELATSYKTTGQALDGLSETVTNTLMPSFELFQGRAIKAVEKVIEKVEAFDGQKIADTIGGIFDAFDSGGITGAIGEVTGLLDKLPEGFKKAAAAGGALMAVNTVNTVLDSGLWKAGVAGIGEFQGAVRGLPGVLSKGLSKGATEAGNTLLNITSRTFPQVLTGLSKIGDTAKTAWHTLADDSLLGKITGIFGKVGGVIGKAAGAVGGQLASGLQTMMGIALKALMPAAMIGAALAGLGLLQEKFGEQINSILAMVQEKGPQVISNFANGIASRVPELISQGATLVSNLLNTIGSLAPSMVGAGVQIITSLVGGVAQSAPQLITSAVTAVGSFASSILAAVPSLLATGMQLLVGVAQGISANLPRMAQGAMQAIQTFAQNFMSNLPTILTAAGQIVISLVQGITAALPSLASGAVSIIGTLVTGFIQNLPQIIQTGVQVVASLAVGLIQGIGTLIGMVPQLFGTIKDAIINTDWLSVGKQIITAIGDGIVGGIGGIGGKVGEMLGGIGDWITGGNKAGTDYATAASESITANVPTVTTAAQTAAMTVSESSMETLLSGGTQSGLSMMTGLSTGITANTGLLTDAATTAMAGATDILTDGSIQSDADSAGQDLVSSAASGIDAGASTAELAVQSTMSSALMAITDSSVEAQTAGQSLGTAVVEGMTAGLEPLGTSAQQAVSTAVSSMQSGLSAMQSAGQQAGQRFAQGIRTGLTQAATAARTSVKTIVSALKSSVSPAQAAGKQAGAKYAAGIRAGMSAAKSAGTSVGKNAVTGMKSVASSAKSAGSSVGSKFASGVSSKTGSARSAGKSLANAAKSGMSGVSTSSIGRDMGQGLANGINSKYGAVASAARRLANAAAQAMRAAAKVASPSKVTRKIGGYIGEGLEVGIVKRTSSAVRTSKLFMQATLQAMRDEAQIASPSKATEQMGGYLLKGFANGVTKNIAQVKGIAIGAMSATLSGIGKAVEKTIYNSNWGANDFLRKTTITIMSWGNLAATNIKNATEKMKNAFGAGMQTTASSIASTFKDTFSAKMKTIGDSAAGYITTATTAMVNKAKAEQERYQKAYDWNSKMQKEYEKRAKNSKASSAEKKAAAKKAKEYAALATKYKATAEKYKNLAASYTKAGSAMQTAFNTAFNNTVNAAINNTVNAINNLAETYQAQYDAIIKARTEFRDKMSKISIGEYDNEKKSVTALTDFNVAKRQVEQYGSNLEKLKGIMPEGFMNEILGMDTDEGLAYTEKLLSKGTDWLKEYAKSYNAYMSSTSSVSNKYYQSQIDTLHTNYTKAVEAEFSRLQSSLTTIGQQVMQGFADGMQSKKTALDNAGKALANSVISTLKSQLQIHSPSKVMASIGSYTGQGFVNGVEDQVRAAREAMQNLVETPRPQLAMAAGAENLRLHDEYNYTSNRYYTFEAVTTLDGREIARSTAEYTEDELERRRKNSERMKGRR